MGQLELHTNYVRVTQNVPFSEKEEEKLLEWKKIFKSESLWYLGRLNKIAPSEIPLGLEEPSSSRKNCLAEEGGIWSAQTLSTSPTTNGASFLQEEVFMLGVNF